MNRTKLLLLALALLLPLSLAADCGEELKDEDEVGVEHDQQPQPETPDKGPNETP